MVFLFRLSQKIEPGTSTPRANASKEDLAGKMTFFSYGLFTLVYKYAPPSWLSPKGQEASASPLCGRKCTISSEVPATPPSPRNLLPYGHRKCHSLGYKSVYFQGQEKGWLLETGIIKSKTYLCYLSPSFIHKMNTVEFKSATFPNAGSRHLLDDSVMESHSPSRCQAESSTLSSGISLGKTHTHIYICI